MYELFAREKATEEGMKAIAKAFNLPMSKVPKDNQPTPDFTVVDWLICSSMKNSFTQFKTPNAEN